MARRQRSQKRKSRGGGYSLNPSQYISAGNLVHTHYSGVGKDCIGVPVRPGYINGYSGAGIPGHAGGSRRRSRGGTRLEVASFQDAGFAPSAHGIPPSAPAAAPPAAAPAAPSAAPSAPGVPPQQKGGRYGAFLAPLTASGIGASSYGGIQRIGCENSATTANRMNGLPLRGGMRGGAALGGAPVQGLGSGYASSNFPLVNVGAADSMRYNAPTAGYANRMEAYPAGGAVGGLTMQQPYAAGSFNQSCIKTGGSYRKKNKRGGALPVALNAGAFSRASMGEIGSRFDFDGTRGGLPVKFGGTRSKRSRRSNRSNRRSRNNRK